MISELVPAALLVAVFSLMCRAHYVFGWFGSWVVLLGALSIVVGLRDNTRG
jgi:hypothetical protein